MTDPRMLARRFETQRPRLVALAAQLLGSQAEADDVVQEAWLRLTQADADGIDNLDAWLTTVVSRLSLDVLRSARHRRDRPWQVTPWDEPAVVDADPADAADDAIRVTAALHLVLETLSPAERLVFVLHDVFGVAFAEIAQIVGKSDDAVRQLGSRARRRVRGAEPASATPRSVERSIVHAWLAAVERGDFAALLELLDEGAVLHADYGEHAQQLRGAREIAEQAMLAARLAAHSTPVLIDGMPGVAAVLQGRVVSLMAFALEREHIVALDVLADPARLAELDLPGSLV
jgi:RNA polymerase sigma-70 factor (ECF subfamily)